MSIVYKLNLNVKLIFKTHGASEKENRWPRKPRATGSLYMSQTEVSRSIFL